jgi:hypothetical protein
VREATRWRDEQDDAERKNGDALLVGEPLIHCNEDIELGTGELQQFSVERPRPAPTGNSTNCMTVDVLGEIAREIFVKKDAHRTKPNPEPVRVQRSPGLE